MVTELTRGGITLTFGADVTTGKFASGRDWLVSTAGGNISVIGISPNCLSNKSWIIILRGSSAGNYTIGYGGQTTGNLAWDADNATIKAAIEGLSSVDFEVTVTQPTTIDAGNAGNDTTSRTRHVMVTMGGAGPWTALTGTDVDLTLSGTGAAFGVHERHVNGAVLNPDPNGDQGFDAGVNSRVGNPTFTWGAYYEEVANVALDVSESAPLSLEPGDMLVCSISHPFIDGLADHSCIEEAQCFRVLTEAPPDDSFDHGYCDAIDGVPGQWVDSMLGFLPNLDISELSVSYNLEDVEEMIEYPWVSYFVNGPNGREARANIPNYGENIGENASIIWAMLCSDQGAGDKSTLLKYAIQAAIDLWSVVTNHSTGAVWPADGGQASGFKPIILLGGGALASQGNSLGLAMIAAGSGQTGEGGDYVSGEDDQTFYVEETSPGVYNNGHGGYDAGDVGLVEWGIRHGNAPQLDSESWGAEYRQCCTARNWWGYHLAAMAMGLRAEWAHEAFFDYQPRYFTVETATTGGTWLTSDAFILEFWEAYYNTYNESVPDGAPTLEVSAASTTSLEIAIAAVASARYYKIERSDDGSTGWARVGMTATTEFIDTGLEEETEYFYRVTTANGGGDGETSLVQSGITGEPEPDPEPSVTRSRASAGTVKRRRRKRLRELKIRRG